jgi:hypothetical protein
VPERQIRQGAILGPVSDLPLPAVPEGYAVERITTDAKGGQTIRARVAHDPREDATIPDGFEVARISTLRNGAGEILNQWEIRTPGKGPGLDVWRELAETIKDRTPAAEPRTRAPGPSADHLLALYPLGDPHLGLRGVDGSGLAEGADLLYRAVADLVERGPRTRECLIVNLGDYYHSDDPSNRTRRGGFPLDVDGEWFEILKVGRDVAIALIDAALGHHEIVNVKCLIGNHDDLSSLFLTLLLEAHFRNEPRVRVDTSGAAFQWFEWGQNLFGFTHGQHAKRQNLVPKMANEQREAWGRTIHRYWHVGHVHHDYRAEVDGVPIESHRTLAPKDGYHEAAGYLAGRDLKRITYHREHGEVSRETVSARMLAG